MNETKRILVWGLTILVGMSAIPAQAKGPTETRTLEERVAFSQVHDRRLVIDNVFGSIVVRASDGDVVEMVARETVYADSAARLEAARAEVELRISERDGEVELFVDGPFRCREDRHEWSSHHRDPGYRVVYDIEVRVPYYIELDLSTVNEGDIHVEDVRGDFRIHNVNGSIRLERMAGSGEVETVNGPVEASFASAPLAETTFSTVNGEIDVAFPADLSADLELASRFGELWSGYRAVPLPVAPPETRTEGGRTVIETARGAVVRVGSGGPRISFETLNGNIYVRKSATNNGEDDNA